MSFQSYTAIVSSQKAAAGEEQWPIRFVSISAEESAVENSFTLNKGVDTSKGLQIFVQKSAISWTSQSPKSVQAKVQASELHTWGTVDTTRTRIRLDAQRWD